MSRNDHLRANRGGTTKPLAANRSYQNLHCMQMPPILSSICGECQALHAKLVRSFSLLLSLESDRDFWPGQATDPTDSAAEYHACLPINGSTLHSVL